MKEIKLTKGLIALVNDEDFDSIKKYNWRSEHGYAVTGTWKLGNVQYMHNIILPKREGFQVDHIDRNRSNNQRNNLRYVTSYQNVINTGMLKNNTSGYKGVSWNTRNGKWEARISVNGSRKSLGTFHNIHEAALAYNKAAIEFHKEFAELNILLT